MAQYEILRMLVEHDVITSIDAGRIVHAHREPAVRAMPLRAAAVSRRPMATTRSSGYKRAGWCASSPRALWDGEAMNAPATSVSA